MVIESGGWLTDQHIHAANKLLSKQFPELQGLQSTLLSQNGGFVPVTSDGTAVQIHFCNGNHWVASSYRNQIISVYDSRPSRTMSTGLQEQLAHLYGHLESSMEDNGLTIHHVPVQRQQGLSDCGPFVIAFALHAALGHDLKDITFDQEKLRGHLLSCFSDGHLAEFPVTSAPVQRACKAKVSYVPLYCDCRLPKS